MAEALVTKLLTAGDIKPLVRRIGIELVMASGGFIRVRGNCMQGTIPEGASVRLSVCSPSDLRPGDVVLVEGGNSLSLHRFLRIASVNSKHWLLTKGDSAVRPDPLSPPQALVGRLVEIRSDTQSLSYTPSWSDRLCARLSGFFWIQFLVLRSAWRGTPLAS
jgi:hypothetical protein